MIINFLYVLDKFLFYVFGNTHALLIKFCFIMGWENNDIHFMFCVLIWVFERSCCSYDAFVLYEFSNMNAVSIYVLGFVIGHKEEHEC